MKKKLLVSSAIASAFLVLPFASQVVFAAETENQTEQAHSGAAGGENVENLENGGISVLSETPEESDTVDLNTLVTGQDEEGQDIVDENVYSYSASQDGYTTDLSGLTSPSYYVFAGAVDEEGAEQVVNDLGMASNLHEQVGSVYVVTPTNGATYEEQDVDHFINLLGAAVSNAKVIGLYDGATFVNNFISQNSWAVAGALVIGGDIDSNLSLDYYLPTYLSNPTKAAEEYYISANSAEKVSDGLYQNPDNPLAQVAIGQEKTLAEAFANAWDAIFSKNYRQCNEVTEFYMTSAATHTDPYGLIGIADFDALDLTYIPNYSQPLNGEGEYTWFEYVPNSVLADTQTKVPLVISLHGNGNDARLQAETTGWAELASSEGFILVCPEWQDIVYDSSTHEPGPNAFNCDGLEGDKLIEWIEMLKVKYPQIDASRIYLTGLSAGASASTLYGAKYKNYFAAIAAVSGPGLDKAELSEIAKTYDGEEIPWLYICGDHDFFGMIPVDGSSENAFMVAPGVSITDADPNTKMFEFIQAYQKINGLEVSDGYDLEKYNPYYGIALDNEHWFKLGEKDALEGTLSNENGVIIKLVAIKNQAHWNYKPEAAYIWDFFTNYARNTETGELIRVEEETETPAASETKPVVSTTPASTAVTSTENSGIVNTAVGTNAFGYMGAMGVSLGAAAILLLKRKED